MAAAVLFQTELLITLSANIMQSCEEPSLELKSKKVTVIFHLSPCFFHDRRNKTCSMCACIHGWVLLIAEEDKSLDGGCISYMFWSALSRQLMPAFALCDVVTSRSRPPYCKLKQMSDEGKGPPLRNGGALPRERSDVAAELTDVESNC